MPAKPASIMTDIRCTIEEREQGTFSVVSDGSLFPKERNNNSEKINCIGFNDHSIG